MKKEQNEIVKAVFNIDFNRFKPLYEQGNFDVSLCQETNELPYPLHYITVCWDIIFSYIEEWKEKYKPILRKRKQENDKFKSFFETECGLDMSNVPFSDYWECFYCAEPDEDVEECLCETVEYLHEMGLSGMDIELAVQVEKFNFDEVERLLKLGADPLKDRSKDDDDTCVSRIYHEVLFIYSMFEEKVLGKEKLKDVEIDLDNLLGLAAHEKMNHLLDKYHSNHKE